MLLNRIALSFYGLSNFDELSINPTLHCLDVVPRAQKLLSSKNLVDIHWDFRKDLFALHNSLSELPAKEMVTQAAPELLQVALELQEDLHRQRLEEALG